MEPSVRNLNFARATSEEFGQCEEAPPPKRSREEAYVPLQQPARTETPSFTWGVRQSRSQNSPCNRAVSDPGSSYRARWRAERSVYQMALQNLSEPESEANPPEGHLAIPLMKHQRIALSWMVQKETSSSNCLGGFLADEQGLGKTVTTIALVLKERPQPPGMNPEVEGSVTVVGTQNIDGCSITSDQIYMKTDDTVNVVATKKPDVCGITSDQIPARVEDLVTVVGIKEEPDACGIPMAHISARVVDLITVVGRREEPEACAIPTAQISARAEDVVTVVGTMEELDACAIATAHVSAKGMNPERRSKGMPAGGTLIVCPTSVLQQWAEEFLKKVTSEANLYVLVHHGSNRTKDPDELAKYDVVLTTYSIVSIEVPMQAPIEYVDDDYKWRMNGAGEVVPFGLRSNCVPDLGDDRPNVKRKAGALAKVEWFRVVLDEAQIIKNHRTRVSRSCWGLEAKRRWCLSGTPIQNAIDDLFSYFTFLRYEPYTTFSSFCYAIKKPIQDNPVAGYKKLQAVLRTIMLRRKKGTLLDDKPILSLPPKLVQQKNLDFTYREQSFYVKLEEAFGDQFKEFAAARTVNNNYARILLMLLRLRQACDHSFLTRTTSLEMLPNNYPSLCGTCTYRTKASVVSVCGHSFCDECIFKHLSSNDAQCPIPQCDYRISDSSKIRAAMEVLKSMNKPADSYQENPAACNVNARVKVVGDKAIVFSQWTKMLDLLEHHLRSSSINYRRLDGEMSVLARDQAVKDFTNLPEVTVIIVSLKAASLGLNLVAANYVLLLDLWWNPTTEDQAFDRAHRIGQTRPVNVYRFTVRNSVEDRILQLQEKKRKIIASAFGENSIGGGQTRLTVEDLKFLFNIGGPECSENRNPNTFQGGTSVDKHHHTPTN